MLNWLLYDSPADTFVFQKNDAQSTIMKNIIDTFSTSYPGLISYSGSSVEVSAGTAKIDFSHDKMFDALKKVANTTTYWWSIDNNGVLQFHPKTGGAIPVTHILTVGKDIELLEAEENSERIVNRYIFKYAGGSVNVSNDASSQALNGIREFYQDRSSDVPNDAPSISSAGSAYISQNKDAKRRIRIVVNSKYDIDSIRAGHFVTVRNFDYTISFLQIVRIEYNMDTVNLELEELRSVAQEILS